MNTTSEPKKFFWKFDLGSTNAHKVLLLGALVVLLSLTMTSLFWAFQRPVHFTKGEIAAQTIRASRDIEVNTNDAGLGVLKVQRGQVIVRAGDVVNSSQDILLHQLLNENSNATMSRMAIGYMLLATIVLLSTYYFTTNFWPGFSPGTKDLTLIALTVWGSLVLIKLFSILSEGLSYSFSAVDATTFILATPLAAGGIILQLTLGAPAVVLFVLTFTLLTGVYLQDSWLVMVLITVGNFVAATAVKRCSRRSTFIIAGLRVAAVNMLVVTCFLLFYPELTSAENTSKILWAAIGGFFSGLLSFGLIPFAEFLGGYVTDFKLLELASLDRPLLRDLSLQAPGTWNHSMVMGQMAEIAAEAIGANPLLARVGAFYHDVGKSAKPAYFVENQVDENRHDKLTPSMSALIIKTHVKDGIEMAEEHRLPKILVDFIPQHHGTSLIEYFYEKALKEAEDGDVVDQSLFRYPGPKPQTKEAGILMLADGVEASARTLNDPTPAKIRGLVQKIINKVFSSGELGECNLTLKDLHLIAKSFTRVLTGIYHRRIEYSEPAEKVRETKTNKQRSESSEAEPDPIEPFTRRAESTRTNEIKENGSHSSENQKKNEKKEALKRLGM